MTDLHDKEKKTHYKYVTFTPFQTMVEIMQYVEAEYKDGWKVVSHNQNQHGISFIFERL